MKDRCSGWKNCSDRNICLHAKPHIKNTIEKDLCFIALGNCSCIPITLEDLVIEVLKNGK